MGYVRSACRHDRAESLKVAMAWPRVTFQPGLAEHSKSARRLCARASIGKLAKHLGPPAFVVLPAQTSEIGTAQNVGCGLGCFWMNPDAEAMEEQEESPLHPMQSEGTAPEVAPPPAAGTSQDPSFDGAPIICFTQCRLRPSACTLLLPYSMLSMECTDTPASTQQALLLVVLGSEVNSLPLEQARRGGRAGAFTHARNDRPRSEYIGDMC